MIFASVSAPPLTMRGEVQLRPISLNNVHYETDDAAILLCHYEVARRSFVGFVERPLYLVRAADHIDIPLPITIVLGQLVDRKMDGHPVVLLSIWWKVPDLGPRPAVGGGEAPRFCRDQLKGLRRIGDHWYCPMCPSPTNRLQRTSRCSVSLSIRR